VAELRPLHGLRYQPSLVGDIGTVIAPPYDVISDEAQRALYARSPYNVVRLEYGIDSGAETDRYEAAAAALADWQQRGIMQLEQAPSLYVYEQSFAHAGRSYARRAIVGRIRLEPWERGVVLPHEHTLSAPKADRLQLLRAGRTNVSPVFALYRSAGEDPLSLCGSVLEAPPALDAVDGTGQSHRLWAIEDAGTIAKLQRYFTSRTLYIADGHHRYETALTYREERRASRTTWTDEEPENFVLMALTAADDPGLLILPIHRLVRPVAETLHLRAALEERFRLTEIGEGAGRLESFIRATSGQDFDGAAVVMLGPAGAATLLQPESTSLIEATMPAGESAAWRRLAVNILQYGVLEPLLGIDLDTLRKGENVLFTESADEAIAAVSRGEFPLAFLLHGVRPDEIFAVADAGDRMPQKSTYFYPKLGTGLVLYTMDADAGA
jgi:uncharacterized protein (DUF1015 family)